jgi:sugar phosphate isomerase/epimerase
MKLCMMSYTMERQPEFFDLREMLELTQELGLAGIDFAARNEPPVAELRRMAEDYGLPVACYTFSADLNFPEAAERQPGVDAAKRGLEYAAALGTDKVMIPVRGKPGVPRETSRRNILLGLQAVIGFAQDLGVRLTIENFPGADSAFVVASDVLQAVREVPGLGLTFDNGNVFTGGEDPAASFTQCASYVIHAHFKDWSLTPPGEGLRGLDGRSYRGALIGEGVVDHQSCLEAMRAAHYEGFINIEYEGNDYPPAEAVRRATAYLRGLLEEW